MQAYDELVELARIGAFNARNTLDPRVAAELWKMALEYQAKAAKLDSGRSPDVGPPPYVLREQKM